MIHKETQHIERKNERKTEMSLLVFATISF